MKKPITAISEGNCRLLNPEMACPDVQPPAYLGPKPTNRPPINNTAIIKGLAKVSVANISGGI